MAQFSVLIPYWNGGDTIERLLDALPSGLPVIVVDDQSDEPLSLERDNVRVIRPDERGYFSGAVNAGIRACDTDVLVVNQDAMLKGDGWVNEIEKDRRQHVCFGDPVLGHPAWPEGYVQGTFMFMRRDAIDRVGVLNATDYPLWGSTCEWQLRVARAGFSVDPNKKWGQWLSHGRDNREYFGRRGFGPAVAEAIRRERGKARIFTRTPPMLSVIVPCHDYGRYLQDCLNSLLGGDTCLGKMDGQTFTDFEVVIVDDASTDDSLAIARSLADPTRGVRVYSASQNLGTPGAINAGVKHSYGEYVHVLSADDMREPWCLETQLKAIRGKKLAAYGDITVFGGGERKRELVLPPYNFEQLIWRNFMPAGITYPREAYNEAGGYPEGMRWGREDWAFSVALGVAGCCGVHVGHSGNLYRREGQNRSRRTGNRHRGERRENGKFNWGKYFLEQMVTLFPEIYAGERPMACCGGRRRTTKVPASKSAPAKAATVMAARKALPGRDGMVRLEFIGGSQGAISWYGPETGTRYIFSADPRDRVGYVDAKDAQGMLTLKQNRRPLFRTYRGQTMTPPPKKAMEEAQPGVTEDVPDRMDEAVVEEVGINATDTARQFAEELGVEIASIEGTGKDGRITVADVKKAAND